MLTIPSNKKWIISYLGDFFGQIINAFNIDLFSSPGRIGVGKKYVQNTTNDDITDLSPVYGFTTATLCSGSGSSEESGVKKVWAIAKNKVLKTTSEGTFEEDLSEGLGEIDEGSDILAVKETETEEDLESTQYYVTIGKNLTSAFQITGSGDNVKWAQSIKVIGNLKALTVYLRKVKSPSDSIHIGIQEDDEGVPSGTDLSYVEKQGSLLTTTFTEYTFEEEDWSEPIYFDVNKKYWLVFSRTGSADTENFYLVKLAWGGDKDAKEDDPYIDGEIKNYNGSGWTKQNYTLRTDTFTSSGTWTVPTGVTEAYVECWGAGGGGTAGVGGGGGGAYAAKLVSNLTPGSNISITVGTSAENTDGGNSVFGSNVVVAAGGKKGGNGGTGGSVANSIGDIKYSGGNGQLGTGDCGGGGGAGNKGAGGSADAGYPGVGGNHNGGDGDGRPIGGGGTSTASNGNSGANGEVRITYKTTVPEGYPAIKSVSFFKQFREGYPYLSIYFRLPPNATPGDMIILIMAYNGSSEISISGWTKICGSAAYNDYSYLGVYYKVVDGTEQDITFTTPSTVAVSAIMYCIANADIPTGTAAITHDHTFNSPSHSQPISQKALWLSIGSVKGSTTYVAFAPPTNFQSMLFVPAGGLIKSDYSPGGNRGACIVSSHRFYEGQTLDPDAYSSSVGTWSVGATIAIPYKENTYYYDLTAKLDTYLPVKPEKIFVTTKDDIMMLDVENSQWYSIWYGLLKQEKLNSNYPRIIKSWGLGEVIFVANENKLHSFPKWASNATDVELERIVVPAHYYANWMAVSKTAIFVGFAHKDGETLPSVVLIYDPYTEYSRTVEIQNGATVGFVYKDICYIIDKKGELSYWTGSQFERVNYLPGYYSEGYIELPHRNGFAVCNGEVHMLWKGNYPYPAGIWRFSEGQFYHTGSIENHIDLEETGALYYDGTRMYCGASYDNTQKTISGIFQEGDAENGWIITSRIYSPSIKQLWHNIALKYLVPKPGIDSGNFVVKYRTEPPKISEGKEADIFMGEWQSNGVFKVEDTNFWTYYSNNQIVAGDEIIIRTGTGAGKITHISSVNATNHTITCSDNLGYTSGTFTFSVENWQKVNFPTFSNLQFSSIASLDDKRSEWIQFKIGVSGNFKLEEIQLSSVPDFLIDKK